MTKRKIKHLIVTQEMIDEIDAIAKKLKLDYKSKFKAGDKVGYFITDR